MRDLVATSSGAVTAERPIADQGAGAPDTAGSPESPMPPRPLGQGRASARTRIGRLLWTLAGVLATALTISWLLWSGRHPLLGTTGVNLPVTYRLSPAAFAGALAAWTCFTQAFRR